MTFLSRFGLSRPLLRPPWVSVKYNRDHDSEIRKDDEGRDKDSKTAQGSSVPLVGPVLTNQHKMAQRVRLRPTSKDPHSGYVLWRSGSRDHRVSESQIGRIALAVVSCALLQRGRQDINL